ncbi:MAG TPA: glutamine synthetase III [Candidatus Limiplasma pullistercoris]|nr:glutamine synthetase III [Candidatus Limiplasma pullistercoris]
MENPSDLFGEYVFNDSMMQKRLPKETYRALKRTIEQGRSLDPAVAGVVANAMKDWALEMGATHYTHWFQPMTGVTAEKHDAFITPLKDGKVLLEFGGKELVRGEPDASSFPSGGLRATFEARGYTAWDPTSYAFIKEGTLCIPTAFCSYGGQALDKKTPLLRSMQALSKQALRILRIFGNTDAVRVFPTVGPEQEYFLVDKEVYRKRPDLMVAGRTLFGAKPPKGQELEDHYFGVIKPRVQAFMKELDAELWKLGILAKTEHNEVAPAQHEMAPIYTTVNIAADHNQLTMDIMKKVADRHGMVCLLHEKPFEGVNGSGKHNNYALSTDTGVNLLDPGDTPSENAQFLVFLSAVIAAVDDYQDLMRVAVASAGNDHRLGANEAPPAIISIFLGDELNGLIESIVNASKYEAHERDQMKLGVHILPRFSRDSTDRNRTSPFAFTGNKFEFRSLGSSQSISGPNVILNTAIADTLMKMADELEAAEDVTAAVDALIRRTLRAHMRIIFNGNGYDQAWVEEAGRRGLLNLPTTVDALPYYVDPKNIELFERQKVFTREEVESRYEIKMETYIKVIDIEAMSMIDISRHLILPAAIAYAKDVASAINVKKSVAPELEPEAEKALLSSLNAQTNTLYQATEKLESVLKGCDAGADMLARARYTRDQVIAAMNEVRAAGDALEGIVGKSYWPMPTYQDLLMSV